MSVAMTKFCRAVRVEVERSGSLKELESRTISFESDSKSSESDEILQLHHQETSKGRKWAELANRPESGKPTKFKGARHLLTEF